MKMKKFLCLVISLLMIICIFPMQAYATQDDSIVLNGNFSKDRVLVKLANNSYTNAMDKITNDSFGISCSEIRLLNPSETNTWQNDGEYSAADITDTQNNVFTLMLEETGTEAVESALKALNTNPAIEIAEPNYIGEYTAVPNDPEFYLQSAAMKCISAPEAWEHARGSNNVVVGIIDSGIQGTHPDLYDNLWTNPNPNEYGYINDIHGYNFQEGCGGTPTDGYGHGTHVSGVIGATGNNELGVSGINWDVSLAWLGVGTSSPNTDAIIEALNYANLHDIKITNNSYTVTWSELLEEAVENYNGLFVAAAGNYYGLDIDKYKQYPASFNFPNVITVASTDTSDNLSYFSNIGPESVDIAAPGSDIYSTYYNSDYKSMSGTSMAAPQVAGVAALLKSEYPDLTTAQIKSAILNSADPLTQLDGKVATGGRLNAYKALQAVQSSIDIYFQNTSNWNKVKLYYWSNKDPKPVNWPGIAMTKVSGNIYKATIPANYDRVIFSNNGSNQTANLTVQGDNHLYIPTVDTWIAYNPDDVITLYYQNDSNWTSPKAYYWDDDGYFNPVTWPGETMTYVKANIYKVVVPSICDKIIFSNNGSNQTSELTIRGDGKIYRPSTGAWSNYNPLTDKSITLYFTNNNNWSNVKAYLWHNTLSTNNKWPGESMSYVGLNDYAQPVYSITFDAELYNRIIFNGSEGQTVDIVVGKDGTGYYLTGEKSGSKWKINSYSYK